MSRTTKTVLNRLGVFTVSSFHAYICARSPSLLNNLLAGRGATKRRWVHGVPLLDQFTPRPGGHACVLMHTYTHAYTCTSVMLPGIHTWRHVCT